MPRTTATIRRPAIRSALTAALLPAVLALAAPQAGAAANPAQYQCGGIGIDESTRMKAEAGQHDMMLTFATDTGAYLADVGVTIADSQGAAVLTARCSGPIMLVDLPGAGRYQVTARYGGVAKVQTVSVGQRKGAGGTFVWPAK